LLVDERLWIRSSIWIQIRTYNYGSGSTRPEKLPDPGQKHRFRKVAGAVSKDDLFSFAGIAPFFVENVPELQLAALKLVTGMKRRSLETVVKDW
jgi:hypothetical protein